MPTSEGLTQAKREGHTVPQDGDKLPVVRNNVVALPLARGLPGPHRQIGLIRDLLDVNEDRKARVLSHLDKGHVDELTGELEAAGMGKLQDDLVALVDLRVGAEVLEQATELVGEQEGLRYLDDLGALLARYAIEDLVFDLGGVRGLDYYTDVFELHYEPLGAASQICGDGFLHPDRHHWRGAPPEHRIRDGIRSGHPGP